MSSCASRDALVKFLAGCLPERQEESVRAHLSECSSCQRSLDELTAGGEVQQFSRSHRDAEAERNSAEPVGELDRVPIDSAECRDKSRRQRDVTIVGGSQHLLSGAPDRLLPRTLGRYQILERLGSGGFGVVYRAQDTQLNRSVALKVPRSSTVFDSVGRGRFLREAKAAAALHHPHIVAVYDAGECQGLCYLASAYCPGRTLADWLTRRDQPASPDEAAQIVLALADAVQHAHDNGVLHRDIKPQNVLLDSTVRFRGLPFSPKLTDFGVAKIVDDEESETVTELVLGTPRYVAPELAAGRRDQLGPACDIYALGVVLYELLTRRAPIDGTSHADTLRRVLTDEPVNPRKLNPAVPRDLEAICVNCLEKTPRRRYASARHMAQDLDRFLQRQPTIARPIGHYERVYRWMRRQPAAATLLAVSIVASLVVFLGLTLYNTRLGALNLDLQQSNANLENALAESDRAKTRAKTSESRTQQLLYVSDMRLAGRAWKERDMRELTDLLKRHIPDKDEADRRGLEWHFLWNQCAMASRVIGQGNEDVYCLRASPDGNRFAAAGKDGVVRIHDMMTGSLDCSITTGQREVNGVDFSPDGQMLVSAGDDGTVRIWRIQDCQQIRSIAAHPDLAFGAIFTRDGKTLFSCGTEAVIKRWDVDTGDLLGILPGHPKRAGQSGVDSGRVDALMMSPDGRAIASVGADGMAKIWDLTTLEEIRTLRGGPDSMTSGAFSSDGTRLATSGFDHTIRLWDVVSGRQLAIGKHLDKCHCVSISCDGQLVVSGDEAGVVQLWKVADGSSASPDLQSDAVPALTLLRNWPAHEGRVHSVMFSPDGGRLITAGADGMVKSWLLPAAAGPRVLRGKSQGISDLTFVPNSRNIAVAFGDHIRLWDPCTGDMVRELESEEKGWRCLGTDRKGALLCACHPAGEVGVWDLATATKRQSWNLGGDDGGRVVSLSPDGSLVAAFAGSVQDVIHLLDVASGRLVKSLRLDLSMLVSISFAPGGERLAITDDRNIFLWNLWTGEPQVLNFAHAGTIHCHAFSQDGSLLATVSSDRLIKLWDSFTGQLVRTLSGHRSAVNSIAFSPDDRSLVSGDVEGFLKVWNVAAGEELFDLHYHPGGYYSRVRIAPDGRQLACSTADDAVLLFDFSDPAPPAQRSRNPSCP
jgi:eukaryotic-like serine/threonine-protein kinase